MGRANGLGRHDAGARAQISRAAEGEHLRLPLLQEIASASFVLL